jgi:hypothetical protein
MANTTLAIEDTAFPRKSCGELRIPGGKLSEVVNKYKPEAQASEHDAFSRAHPSLALRASY